MVAAAELRYLIVDRRPGPAAGVGLKIAVTSLSVLYSIWAMSQAGTEEVYLGFMLFLVGVPLFVLVLKMVHNRRGDQAADSATGDEAYVR
jgi:hypothetical protein